MALGGYFLVMIRAAWRWFIKKKKKIITHTLLNYSPANTAHLLLSPNVDKVYTILINITFIEMSMINVDNERL